MMKKIAYESPKVKNLGDVRKITQSGSPNEAYDGGSIWDFFGPDS